MNTKAAVVAVNLSAFHPADTAVLDILAPGSARPIGWAITFAGPGHPKTVAWNEEKAREDLQKSRQIEMAQVNGRKYKPDDKSVADLRHDNVRWIAARILDWTPVALEAGAAPINFSEAAAMELLAAPKLGWVYGQCLEFLASEQSFTPASAKI